MHKPKSLRPTGMTAFVVVWLGQMVSMLGTGMTRFGITIWAWQLTGEATTLALVGFFSFGPAILLSPVAGALVDRWNRKMVMMFSDLAAGLSTVVILLLFVTGNLQIWHLYMAGAFAGAFEAFQFPAYSAAITTMLPKSQYARANGMLQLIEPAALIASPLLAGILLPLIDLSGILTIDIATFLFAVGVLFLVHIPQPVVTEAGQKSRGRLWQESLYGFHYIFKRPSLLGLQLVFLMGNLISGVGFVLFPAMILARTDNNELILASVQSALGIGGLVGGLALSIWGGPERRIHGLLIGWILAGVSEVVMGVGQNTAMWVAGHFSLGLFIPFINGSNQAIWQAKVAPDVQGRVFATRRLIAQITFPVAMLLAGPLADHLFEPAMISTGSPLANIFGGLVGVGPGAGMGLLFAINGTLIVFVGLAGYGIRVIRQAEDILPDHDLVVASSLEGDQNVEVSLESEEILVSEGSNW